MPPGSSPSKWIERYRNVGRNFLCFMVHLKLSVGRLPAIRNRCKLPLAPPGRRFALFGMTYATRSASPRCASTIDDSAVARRYRPSNAIAGVSNRLHLRFFWEGRHPLCDGTAFCEKRERTCAGDDFRFGYSDLWCRLGNFDHLLVALHHRSQCSASTTDPI